MKLEAAAREAERLARENLPPELALGQMERAVKLGILPPDALRAWLEARNYSAEDVEIVVGARRGRDSRHSRGASRSIRP